jgi:hypothetical protein
MQPSKSQLFVGETFSVDVMLTGDINYTQFLADVTYDPALLKCEGYSNMSGFVTACAPTAPNTIGIRYIPSTNMVLGVPSFPEIKVVTLNFTVLNTFVGDQVDTALAFGTVQVNPPAGYLLMGASAGEPAELDIYRVGNGYMQANLAKFPSLWNLETGRTNATFSNDTARVIQEEVWVEAPIDTDFDGKRDLIHVIIRRPIETKPENGGLKCPAIMAITPYVNSAMTIWSSFAANIYDGFADQGPAPTRFSHTAFKNRPAGVAGALTNYDHWNTISGAANDLSYQALRDVTERRVGKGAEASTATYKDLLADGMLNATTYTPQQAADYPFLPPARVPAGKQLDGRPATANPGAGPWDAAYYIPRGYALLQSQVVGAAHSEGVLQYGMYQESLAAAAAIDWLNGRVRAYADPTGLIEVEAYWATGEAAAAGTSYGGTLPMAAAITGVEGLRTIFTGAPVTNAYNYFRENSTFYAPGNNPGENIPTTTVYCYGRIFNASSMVAPSPAVWDVYWDWLQYLWKAGDLTTGNYGPFWDERNPLSFGFDMRKDVGVIMGHGYNDGNVKFRNTAQLNEMLKYYDIEVVKGLFHQGGHSMGNGRSGAWTNTDSMHLWADHYLYGVENGIVEKTPNYSIESNIGTAVWNSYDTWPRLDGYQKFYPNGGRVGSISATAPATSTSLTFQDDYLARATYPTMNYPNISNGLDARLRANGLNNANGYLQNALIVKGQGVALPSSQRNIWGNVIVGGLESNATGWSGNDLRLLSSNAALTAQLSKTKEIKDRLLFLTDIDETFTISGFTKMTAEVAASKDVGVLSAMLLEWKPTSVKIVAIGSVDVRNPNPDGTITPDVPGLANITKGGNWHANYLFQSKDILPYGTGTPAAANFNSYTWEMDVSEYTFTKGNQLGLILFGSDPEFTFMTHDPTEFTVNIGPNTYLSLPVVGGPVPLPAPAAELIQELAEITEIVEPGYTVQIDVNSGDALEIEIL